MLNNVLTDEALWITGVWYSIWSDVPFDEMVVANVKRRVAKMIVNFIKLKYYRY